METKGKKKREDIQPVPWGLKERQKIFDRLKNKQIRLKMSCLTFVQQCRTNLNVQKIKL